MFSGLKHQLTVFAPLGAGLLIMTLITALSGLWHYNHEVAYQAPAKAFAKTAGLSVVQSGGTGNTQTSGSAGAGNKSLAPGSNVSKKSTTHAQATNAVGIAYADTPAPNSTGTAATAATLTLSINHQSKGSLAVAAGSNQCDVLKQALAAGMISNLDMRYDTQYKTYGVYVINGIGDPGTVWWTYTVNGVAPPYGCGYVTAHSGDSVNWQYIKS